MKKKIILIILSCIPVFFLFSHLTLASDALTGSVMKRGLDTVWVLFATICGVATTIVAGCRIKNIQEVIP
jgi:hypothetical protein